MKLRLFNTASRKIEEFKPLRPQHVGMYSCGLTVYYYAHIGNLRTYTNSDILRRTLEYMGLKGSMCDVDTRIITEIAHYYRSIGTRITVRYPFIRDDFHKTRAGIHADGLSRDERIYSIFDTVKLLDRPPEVVVTDKSGTDGVHLWVNNYLGLHGDDRIKRTKLVRISRWVTDQYDVEGRTTAISDREMAALVKEHLPEQFAKAAKEGRLVYTHHEE